MEKVPYMIIIGDKEVGAGNISVRTRKGADEGSVDLESFINRVHDEVKNRTVD